MTDNTPVLMVVFVFMFVPLVLAEVARNKSIPTLEDFFLQGRGMHVLPGFFTIYSTWMSAFAFIGASAFFYDRGPAYITSLGWDALFAVLIFVIGRRIWFYSRENGYMTPAGFFRDIYGSLALERTVTLVLLFFTLIYLQIQLSGGAYIIEVATGGTISWKISGFVFYLIIVIYLWAGGLRAVALADIFYGICLMAAMVAAGIFLINKAGGFEHVFTEIIAEDPDNGRLPGPQGDAGAMLWISMFLVVPSGALMGPQMWIRCSAIKEKKTFYLLPMLLCMASVFSIGTLFAGSAGIVLKPGGEHSETIVISMLVEYAGPVTATLILCGIAAAALSTANSQIHAISAIYTMDIHKRYLSKENNEKKLVTTGKLAVLFISAAAYISLLTNKGIMIDMGLLALGGTAQIIVPVIGAFFWERSKASAGLWGIICGICVLAVGAFIVKIDVSIASMGALAVNGAIFIIVSLLGKEEPETRRKIVLYKERFKDRVLR